MIDTILTNNAVAASLFFILSMVITRPFIPSKVGKLVIGLYLIVFTMVYYKLMEGA